MKAKGKKKDEKLDTIIIPKGKIVKFDGIPVRLQEDAIVWGNVKNFHTFGKIRIKT